MKLRIDNIGVLNNSLLNISGLTVIVGNNNSGKSTVGKAISSVITSLNYNEERMITDGIRYANLFIDEALANLRMSYFRHRVDEKVNINTNKYPYLAQYLDKQFTKRITNNPSLFLDFVNGIKFDIEELEFEDYLQLSRRLIRNNEINEKHFNIYKRTCLNSLNKHIAVLAKNFNIDRYTKSIVLDDLNLTFNSQILPVKNENCVGSIQLSDMDTELFSLKVTNDELIDFYLNKNPISKCYLIDDVSVLDESFEKGMRSLYIRTNLPYYKRVLYRALSIDNSSFENQVYKELHKDLLNIIKTGFFDDIVFNDGKYVCRESKLNIKNLASGSKMFAILKVLFEKGKIDDSSLIVLDEPENHLHPQRQLVLANLIVKTIKSTGAKFIITTHSPSFLYALSTYSKINNINELSNYYYAAKQKDNYSVELENVNLNMDKIFYSLNKPFIDIDTVFASIEDEEDEQY